MTLPPAGPGQAEDYRPDVDGLRAVAVLAVLAFHVAPYRAAGGFVGVDVFFVISGYLISRIILGGLERGTFTFASFYARRIRRIFPALLVVLIPCIGLLWYLAPPDSQALGKQIAAGAGFFSNLALWTESGYFDPEAAGKPLLHLWSLGVEEQFYILWPALLFVAFAKKVRILPVILSLAVASFALNVFQAFRDPTAAYFSPLGRLWELALGGLLAGATRMPMLTTVTSNMASVAGAGLIVSSITLISGAQPYPGAWALLPTIGTALAIAAGPRAFLNKHILGNRVVTAIGRISYPLYLWHWLILYFTTQYLLWAAEPGQPRRYARVATVPIAIVAAWLTQRFVESPIRFGRFKQRAVAPLAVAMLLVFFAGTLAYVTDGFAFRGARRIAEVLAYRHEHYNLYREKTCLLSGAQRPREFADCTNHPTRPSETIILWGDSHAAHLFPGYTSLLAPSVKLTQRTTASCAPILHLAAALVPHCEEINDAILAQIRAERPDRVIVAAHWDRYDWEKVRRTIEALKAIPIKRIDLIGPVAEWRFPLAVELYRFAKANRSDSIPPRLPPAVWGEAVDIDKRLRQLSVELGLHYESPFNTQCSAEGCITLLGRDPGTMMTWDKGHLTKAGSIFVVSHFAP